MILKDHVTLKTDWLLKFSFAITGIKFILKIYYNRKHGYSIVIIFYNITIFAEFLHKINASLVSIRDFFQKTLQKS